MKIGELAKTAQTQTETIRYYEREGLLPEAARTEANYRIYDESHVQRLAFIRHCRSLDMTLAEIRTLLSFKDTPDDSCADVNALLDEHIGHVASRIRELKALEKDPLTRWRVTAEQWRQARSYDELVEAEATAVRLTDASQAPWMLVDGSDERHRSLVVARVLRDRVTPRLDEQDADRRPRRGAAVASVLPAATRRSPLARARKRKTPTLASLDMSRSMEKATYEVALAKAQGRLNLLHRKAHRRGLSTIVVFEGWDAAGKGGAIRRVASALDAREYQVIPVAAPTDEERAQHYLWRFWRHMSRSGRLTVFDRSWYGRVLVERVEGFATDAEWQRAYAEINDFEAQLVAHGIVLVKYWVHITKDEQLRRFKQRERLAHKRWKLTDEDWRNRKQWKAYEKAVDDMVAATSARHAPWTLVEGDDKNHARLKVLRTLADRLAHALHEE